MSTPSPVEAPASELTESSKSSVVGDPTSPVETISTSSSAETPISRPSSPEEKTSNSPKSSSATPRPILPLLRTPASAGPMLPSELPRSPHPGWFDIVKREDDIRTPITPPSAYIDFLKALSPAISTPLTSASPHSTFSFTDAAGKLTPMTQPSSAASIRSCQSDNRKPSICSAPLVPPSPFVRPPCPRTPSGRAPPLRRLRIPQSPSGYSPASDSPRSSTTLRSPFSPTHWYIEGKTRYFDAPLSAVPRTVSVKQVVTRTVTYTRTPLDPAPKGKRRKIE